jgi:hypothetical protein
MSALSNLYAAAEDIRTLMMPFAFLLCVLGLGETGWRGGQVWTPAPFLARFSGYSSW